MAEWSFGRVQGGVVHGFHVAGIDLFRDHRLDRMVRECIQNALDAQDEEQVEPVHVAFTLSEMVPTDGQMISGLDPFLAVGESQASKGAKKEKDWYSTARKTISKPTISILGVHDANTIGLLGTSEKSANQKSRWLALVHGQGVNLGQGADGLGGFGHGSNAAFAMSRIRTAFYLTHTLDEDEEPISRFQGHTMLETLFLDGGLRTNPDGFFGIEGSDLESRPLTGESIPSTYSNIRKSAVGNGKGTSVFICDPNIDGTEKMWNEILVSVVANFAFALKSGNLKVSIGTDYVLESNSLAESFQKACSLREANGQNGLDVADETWKHLTSVKTILSPDHGGGTPLSIQGFGQAHWFLRVGNEVVGKGVAVAREPGMVVTYKAPQLGSPALVKYKDFDLFVCVRRGTPGKSGAEIIKQMEDPTHTKLEFDRVEDNAQSEVKRKYKYFTDAVKTEILNKYAISEAGEVEVISIEGLLTPTFLGDESEKESMDSVSITMGSSSVKTPRWPSRKAGNDGNGRGNPPEGDGGNHGPGGKGNQPPPALSGAFEIDGVKYEKSQIGRLNIIPTGNLSNGFAEVKVVANQLLRGKTRLSIFVAGETITDPCQIRFDPENEGAHPHGTVQFGNSEGGRQEINIWLPEEKLNLAFGGEVYREL